MAAAGAAFGYQNMAVSGDTAQNIASTASAQLAAQYDGSLTDNIVVLWAGVNDAVDNGRTAAQIYTDLSSAVATCQAAGELVILCTDLPSTTTAANTAGWNTTRATLNTSIRGNAAGADAIADLAANTTIGDDTDSDNTTYYSDKLHPTPEGDRIIGEIVGAAIATLL